MSNRPTIAYQPALDGIRALAVAAVLLFHAEIPGFDGGYLGVSVFFTLSGFLITSLLLHEYTSTGTIDLRQFYARRVRRLLPASLLTVTAVVAIGAFTDLFDGVSGLRDHVLGSAFQVVNWVFLAGDGSYQDLLARSSGSASPLEHFWSLAIEEQFYWVWPPVVLFLLTRLTRRSDQVCALAVLAGTASLAAPVIAWRWGADAAYWASPARFAEILIGALLAALVFRRRVATAVAPIAPAALAVLAVAVALFPSSGGPAYAGALPLIGVVSALLILGVQVDGPVRSVLATRPLVAIGKVSYGLYVFHWPVFVIINDERFDWPSPLLLAFRLVVTAAITLVSYELIEHPIRVMRVSSRPTFLGGLAATGAVAVLGLVGTTSGLGNYWEADADSVAAAAIVADRQPLATVAAQPTQAASAGSVPGARALPPASSVVPEPTITNAPSVTPTAPETSTSTSTIPPIDVIPELTRPVRILVTGDSTAGAFGAGLINWAAERPELAQVAVVSAAGCGFLRDGERRIGDTVGPDEGCTGWVEAQLYPEVERLQPDVVVAMVTSWDIIDRRWDTDELLGPLDASFKIRLEADYQRLADDLAAFSDARLALVQHPLPNPFWLPRVDAQEDPARHEVLYDVYTALSGGSGRVEVIALNDWLRDTGLDQSEEVRPDGIHITPEAATAVASEYLGDQVVRVALGMARP